MTVQVDWNAVLTIALAQIPTILIVALGVLYNNSRIGDTNSRIGDLRSALTEVIKANHESLMQALLRVEGVLDARLKHLEERRP
jgi:cell division protein FtsL